MRIELGHFQHHAGPDSAYPPLLSKQYGYALFCRGAARVVLHRSHVPFGTLPPDSHVGSAPHGSLSAAALRPFSGWLVHLLDHGLSTIPEYSRPTAFAGPPLLTGNDASRSTHLGCVPDRSPIPALHPTHLHASIRSSDLIPAHYSCRSRSPVGSEARDANPDFVHPPFGPARLSPGRVAEGSSPPIRIEWTTSSTSSGLPSTAMPWLTLAGFASGRRRAVLVMHLRLSLHRWSVVLPATCTVSRVAHPARWSRRPGA